MKKSTKALVTLIFCLSIIMATFVPAFAASVAQVKGAKATNVTYNSATLTWTKVSKVSGYEVEKYNDSSKKWAKTGSDVKSSANTMNLTGLTTGTTYKYRVRAFTKAAISGKKTYGAYSATVSVKPMPVQVTGLKASTITATTINLTWTKTPGATGYKVQLYKGDKWTDYKKITSNTNTLAITKLTVNTTYKYRVAAYRTVNKKDFVGAYSATLSVKTAVGAVTSLKSSNIKATTASASWKALTDVTGYNVVLKDPDGKSIVSKNVKEAKYDFTNLIPKKKYTLTVKAYKTISSKNYYGTAATITITPTLAAPTALKTTVKPISIAVSWTKAANVAGYRVQLLDKDAKVISTKTTTGASLTLSDLTPNTTYSVKVCSYVTVSGTNYYSSALASAALKTTVAAPKDLKVTKTTSKTVALSWTASTNATNYEVQYYTGGAWKSYTKTTATTATVSGLSSSTAYKFKVRAYVTASSKTYNSSYTAEVSSTTNIAAVTGLTGEVRSGSVVTVTWNPVSGAKGYVVSCPDTADQDITATKAYIPYLDPNTDYKVTVKAYTLSGTKKVYSDTASVTLRTNITFPHAYTSNAYEYFYADTTTYIDDPSSTYVLRWENLNNVVYSVYRGNEVIAENIKDNFYEIKDAQTFNAKASKVNDYKTKISWDAQSGVSKYTVEVASTNNKAWINMGTYTGTSCELYLAPNTTYVARVIANNGESKSYSIEATDNKDSNRYAYGFIYNATCPELYAVTSSFKTPAAPAYSSSSNESKTLYTLMAVQALNNTKHEMSKVTAKSSMNIDVSLSNTTIGGMPIGWLINTMAPELKDEISESMSETDTQTATFNGGKGSITTTVNHNTYDENGKRIVDEEGKPVVKEVKKTLPATLNEFITPNNTEAVFYNSQDVANFAKRIKSISVTKSGNNTTVKLTLPEESTNASTGVNGTPIHNGFMTGLSDQIADMAGANLKVGVGGKTVLTFVVNEKGTLNSYKIVSPFTMSMSEKLSDSVSMNMVMDGSCNYDYTFTR